MSSREESSRSAPADGEAEPEVQLTLESVRYQLIGSGLEATLVDIGSDRSPGADGGGGGGKAWRCSACGVDFPTARWFDAHLGRHEAVCRRQCHLCDHSLVGTVTQLRRHLATHTAGRPHVCRRCGRAFHSDIDLQQHRRRLHAALFRFRCDLCPRSYSSRSQLRNHCFTHSSPRPHTCSDCVKRFASLPALRNHMRSHRKRFRCDWPDCSYMAHAPTYVRAHVDSVHRKVTRFQCQQCPRGFFMISVLKLHVNRVHGKKSAKFHCGVCGSPFKSRSSLAVHRRSHVTRRTHGCHLCADAFVSSQALDQHMADHMTARGEPHARPFECHCGKTFRTTLTFRRHRMSHRQNQHPRQPHQPQQEQAADVTPPPAGSDTNQQQKEREFQGSPPAMRPSIFCLECGEEFTSGLALELHYQRRHGAAGPFHCPGCGSAFANPRLFARHRAQMHMEYVTDSGVLDQPDGPPAEHPVAQQRGTAHIPSVAGHADAADSSAPSAAGSAASSSSGAGCEAHSGPS